MGHFFVACFLLTLLNANLCLSDDSKESEDDEKKNPMDFGDFGDMFVQPMKGIGDWFKNAADEVKERSEDGMETMKEFSKVAKEKSETGFGAMKGLTEGIGERFGKVKEKIEEHGEKMKDAVSNAAVKTKEEMETAASKVSKHAKDASELMFSMFG